MTLPLMSSVITGYKRAFRLAGNPPLQLTQGFLDVVEAGLCNFARDRVSGPPSVGAFTGFRCLHDLRFVLVAELRFEPVGRLGPVSYTHLTLPTKRIV